MSYLQEKSNQLLQEMVESYAKLYDGIDGDLSPDHIARNANDIQLNIQVIESRFEKTEKQLFMLENKKHFFMAVMFFHTIFCALVLSVVFWGDICQL